MSILAGLSKLINFSLLFTLFLSSAVLAQGLPENNRSNGADVIEKKVLEEAEQELIPEATLPEYEEEKEDDVPVEGELQFLVTKIILEGNILVNSDAFEPLIEPYENNKLTMKDLKKLAQLIENTYRSKGFITSRVFIPPQKVIDGVFRLQIVEGKIGNVEIIGNKHFKKEQILSYSVLKKGKVLEYKDLIKTLEGMNSNPDRSAKAVLKRGKQKATSDVVFNIKDSFPMHLGASFDNQGNLSTGLKRFGFNARHNNLLGKDDILYTGTVFGKDFGVFFAQYAYPLVQWGSRIIAGFSHAQVSPKRDFASFGVNGISQTYFLRLVQPLISTNFFRLGFQVAGEMKDSRTKVLSGTFRKDALQIIRFGPDMSFNSKWGKTNSSNLFSFGTKIFGGDTFLDPTGTTRVNTEAKFFKVSGTTSHYQRMPWGTQLSANVSYQYSTDKLPSSEAFYLGGLNSVRGYPEGDYLADNGFYYNLEYLIPMVFIPWEWQLPFSEVPLKQQIQFVSFLDQGYGRIRNASNRERKWAHLMSVGGGLRIRLYKDLFARTEWAIPLGDRAITEDINDRFRFHFRIQIEV